MWQGEDALSAVAVALIVGLVVAQAGGPEPNSLAQLFQLLLELLSEFASLFDGLFGNGFLLD